MAQEVRHLARRQGFAAAVRLFYTVHQVGSKGVVQGVEPLPLDARGLRDPAVPRSKGGILPAYGTLVCRMETTLQRCIRKAHITWARLQHLQRCLSPTDANVAFSVLA